MRYCALLVVFIAGLPVGHAAESPTEFLKTYCYDCHNAQLREAGLRLDALPLKLSDQTAFETWVKVHDRLHRGEMPPRDHEQPTEQSRAAIVQTLEQQLTAASLERRLNNGRTLFRRLNRTEYENTLRDLLFMPGLQVRDMLPEDGQAHGYDKLAEALELSHVQMAKYLEAAETALSLATAPHVAPPDLFIRRYYPSESADLGGVYFNGDAVVLSDMQYDYEAVPLVEEVPPEYRSAFMKIIKPYRGALGILRHEDDALRPHFHQTRPVYPGMFKIRLSVWGFLWDKGQVLPIQETQAMSLKANSRLLGYFDAPSMKPTVHEITTWLNPGEVMNFNAASLLHVRVSERKGRAAAYVGPGVAMDWLEIEGPLITEWPTASHRALYGDLPLVPFDVKSGLRPPKHPLLRSTPEGPQVRKDYQLPWTVASANSMFDAERLLRPFLRRAFRRPPTDGQVRRYLALVQDRLNERRTLEDSLRDAHKAALCSPEFLYQVEKPGVLDDWSLASRLSYFLWNSMPDETLMTLAEQGKLSEPKTLHAQVDRMLADRRSQRFVEDFVNQWLDVKDFDSTSPDNKLYPEFSPYLHDSMLAEPHAFFRELLDRDLTVTNVVHSDFAMLNQKLAELYEIPGVDGAKLRRVSLPKEAHRGGFITQAAILKVTANGTTTSPVKRGAWVLREIIGQPPSPPPPDIPAVEPDIRGTTTIREQLDKHRSYPVCASCHTRMDPPGLALESFDVIGGWRTRYRSLGEGQPVSLGGRVKRGVGYKHGLAVDSSGETPEHQKFADIDEYKKLLLANRDQIVRNVISQLLVYSTGAPVEFSDRPAVDEIMAQAKKKNYGLKTLIHAVIDSRPFREK